MIEIRSKNFIAYNASESVWESIIKDVFTGLAESKGKFMLSINDHPDIRELFKDFRITQLELAYTVGRDKTGKTSGELVICNW